MLLFYFPPFSELPVCCLSKLSNISWGFLSISNYHFDGEAMHFGDRGKWEVYFLLNFAVNLKLLKKIKLNDQKFWYRGTSLVVQGLRHHTPNARGPGSFPGQGT